MVIVSKYCVEISTEWDIVAARQLGRDEAREVGFGTVDQAKISTAISELARYVYFSSGNGEIMIEKIKQADKTGISVTASCSNRGGINHKPSSITAELDVELERVHRLMEFIEIQANMEKGSVIKVQKLLE